MAGLNVNRLIALLLAIMPAALAADSFAPLYEKWGDQLIVIPGNHDRYTPSSVKAKYYEEYFPNAFAGMGSRVFSKPLNDHLCVIGFDASRPCYSMNV